MEIIAHIRTDFPDKFGVPRQSGVVPELMGRIIFEEGYRDPEAVRGLDEYEYIWVIWRFDDFHNRKKEDEKGDDKGRPSWSPTVRPPRLGGNKRMGVFATRSPNRPNPIGLSSLRLEGIEYTSKGPELIVSGIDMRDMTAVYDIKPYQPGADSHPDTTGGFTDKVKWKYVDVDFPDDLLARLPGDRQEAAVKVLREDPRPTFHHDSSRRYGMSFGGYDIRFTVDDENVLHVFDVEKL